MASPLRFCMVTTFYPPYNFGGDGIFIHRLSNELARRGHKVDVVHCVDAYQLQASRPRGEYPNHENVTVHRLKSKAGFLSPLLTQQTGATMLKRSRLKTILGGNDYDVIHYHNMSLIGLTALAYGDAVKLYTMHEHWLVCPMHVLWKYNREVCTSKNCLSCVVVGKRPPQLWRRLGLRDHMLKHVDGFISPSRFTRDKHHEFGLDVPITHIPYFLPKKQESLPASASDDTATKGQPYFLFVGRLEKIKGVQNLIPVFKARPEYRLLIAGDGEYRETLEDLATGADNIQFLGRLDYAELCRLYRDTTAVIVPSICYEVFGIIIIEAFAMKAPVIAHHLGALPEVIEQSNGGLTYKNEDELLAAMKELAADRARRDELANNGYEAYLKYWTEDSHMEQYFGFVEALREKHAYTKEVCK